MVDIVYVRSTVAASELVVASLIWLFVDQLVQANFEENQNSSIPPGEGGTSGPVPSHQTL